MKMFFKRITAAVLIIQIMVKTVTTSVRTDTGADDIKGDKFLVVRDNKLEMDVSSFHPKRGILAVQWQPRRWSDQPKKMQPCTLQKLHTVKLSKEKSTEENAKQKWKKWGKQDGTTKTKCIS